MYFRVPMFKQSDGTPSASFTSGIYQIKNIVTNKVYIGSSVKVANRLRAHKNYLKANKHQNRHLQRAFNQYGEDAFIFELLEYVEPEQLLEVEQAYLNLLWDNGKRCYNIAKDAKASAKGVVRSPETCRKISEAKKGNKNRLGMPNSTETRLKLSLALKGRCTSEETRRKLSLAGRGRKIPVEVIAKRAKTYMFTSPSGQPTTIHNLKGFCRDNGLGFSNMLRVYSGNRKSHKGWRKA